MLKRDIHKIFCEFHCVWKRYFGSYCLQWFCIYLSQTWEKHDKQEKERIHIHYLQCEITHKQLAFNRSNREGVRISISILKGDGSAWGNAFSIIDKAIIIANSTEQSWVNQTSWAEPSTVKVNFRDAAIWGTNVHDLNCIWRYSIWKRG